ncbi:MAG: hypothetical protein EOO01_43580, partial [Chitinophagaceae bacterium]
MKKLSVLLSVWLLFLHVESQAQLTTTVTRFELGDPYNDQAFGLSMSPDGNQLFFVHSFGGRDQLKLMQSDKKKGKWTKPVPAFFGQVNTREIDPFISPDGQTILFNSRRSVSNQQDKDLDVWMLKKLDGKWNIPFAIESINTSEHETYATIAASGNIYFGVNKTGGYGGGDIYVSKLENGKYLPAENVGFPINTDKDEGNCFIAPDESYMIFSANGYTSSFGGFDLYISFRKNNEWGISINLGDKINTADNDFCPTIFGPDTLFFARSRKE